MNNTLQLLSLALLSVSSLCSAPYKFSRDGLTITLTPAWQQIGHGKAATNNFGGAWICAGAITIKKRVNETLSLTEAAFRWHGAPLKALHASLYRKNSEPFLAIEENLVSDGVWKSSQQLLNFSFANKQTLDPITTFYLVLTVPSSLERSIKRGSFELLASHLPEQVQPYLKNRSLSLALSDLALHKSTKLAQAKY
jgi:hypothetical protein